MREFKDAEGAVWAAAAREEQAPRHHTRWHLIFHPAEDSSAVLALPEIRWQTLDTAERTLDSMSLFDLRRRLNTARRRAGAKV